MPAFTHDTAPTQYVEADGIRFAYRRFGNPERSPLVFFQHFMGNLDDHDPALSDGFAADREIILFNNAGVASSTGLAPDTIEATARDAESFIDALRLRIVARADRDTPVSEQAAIAQRKAIGAYGAAKDPAYTILEGIRIPVLVVNGTNDIIIPTINSYILQQFLPDAQLILYSTPTPATARTSNTPRRLSATHACSSTSSNPLKPSIRSRTTRDGR
jgi:pimeloyl-ACP methyl ester carboxylesterase